MPTRPQRTHDFAGPLQPTGQHRFRRNWRGKLILQIEECEVIPGWNYQAGEPANYSRLTWRDARVGDFHKHGLKIGIEVSIAP